jgi:hypothetical protein
VANISGPERILRPGRGQAARGVAVEVLLGVAVEVLLRDLHGPVAGRQCRYRSQCHLPHYGLTLPTQDPPGRAMAGPAALVVLTALAVVAALEVPAALAALSVLAAQGPSVDLREAGGDGLLSGGPQTKHLVEGPSRLR